MVPTGKTTLSFFVVPNLDLATPGYAIVFGHFYRKDGEHFLQKQTYQLFLITKFFREIFTIKLECTNFSN